LSRIEEAIRRAKGIPEPDQAEQGQQPFMPAWPVIEAEPVVHEHVPAERMSVSSEWRDRMATGPGGDRALIEQFTRLAATLHQARQANSLRTVMVTSATPGDGKTFTACNLAYVMAETYGYRVLLVDADLRRPSISRMVQLPEGVGLGEALRASVPQKLALAQLTPRLTFLPAGRPLSNSVEMLVSPRMQLILEEASSKFDWVILDAPPVAPTSDARLLSKMVDGTLFVIRAGKTQHADVQKSIDMVGRDHILGVVLNDVAVEAADKYDYYYNVGTDPKAKTR
jgi:capsular exopolysaccharide synthesis family protein